MKKISTSLKVLKTLAPMLNYKASGEISAVMTLKDGSRTTSKLNIFETPENIVILNISDAVTLEFSNKEEFESYKNKKFEFFESDKDMYQSFMGMDDETWEEWNN